MASRHQQGCMGCCATDSVAAWAVKLASRPADHASHAIYMAWRLQIARQGRRSNAHARWARPSNSPFHPTSHREAARDAGCPAIRQPSRRLACVCTAVLARHQFIVACRRGLAPGTYSNLQPRPAAAHKPNFCVALTRQSQHAGHGSHATGGLAAGHGSRGTNAGWHAGKSALPVHLTATNLSLQRPMDAQPAVSAPAEGSAESSTCCTTNQPLPSTAARSTSRAGQQAAHAPGGRHAAALLAACWLVQQL